MIDLYTTLLMPAVVIGLLICYTFIVIIEYRHKKIIYFFDQTRKLLKRNVRELPEKYQVLYDNATVIEFQKPKLLKLYITKKLHLDKFYTKGEQELLFDPKKQQELRVIKP